MQDLKVVNPNYEMGASSANGSKILGIVQQQRAAASWHPTIRWVDIIAIGQARAFSVRGFVYRPEARPGARSLFDAVLMQAWRGEGRLYFSVSSWY